MSPLKCLQCGAELLPETKFCRQCGTRITADLVEPGAPATRLFNDQDIVATQRFDPRPTAANPARPVVSPTAVAREPRRSSGKLVLIGIGLVILLVGLVTTFAIMRNSLRSHVRSEATLIYPGARKAMDIVADGGGRAMQLETPDSLEAVDAWYQKTLKPEKIIRLSSTSVVLKNEKTVATIVREGNQTNILIKTNP